MVALTLFSSTRLDGMPWENSALIGELVTMGFSAELAQRAVNETNNDSVSAALDWLLMATSSLPASRATTPRANAARPVTALPGMEFVIGTPVASGTGALATEELDDEEEMLAAAIQESLAPTSSAAPPMLVAQPSEEEQIQLALTASIQDNDARRRQSEEDVRASPPKKAMRPNSDT